MRVRAAYLFPSGGHNVPLIQDQGIDLQQLQPGHHLRWCEGRVELKRWHELTFDPRPRDDRLLALQRQGPEPEEQAEQSQAAVANGVNNTVTALALYGFTTTLRGRPIGSAPSTP